MIEIGTYRQAARIREGWQVRCIAADGTEAWSTVTDVLRVYSPLDFVRFTFDDGTAAVNDPVDQVFCRTLAEIKRAEAAS